MLELKEVKLTSYTTFLKNLIFKGRYKVCLDIVYFAKN